MIPTIKILFIGAPSKATIQNQLFLLSNKLPIRGHFIESPIKALSYLRNCSLLNFPDVLILDEDLGRNELYAFFKAYRQEFYIAQMDSLLYISSVTAGEKKKIDTYPLITGYLCKPLNKAIFLKEIYPMISFTMV